LRMGFLDPRHLLETFGYVGLFLIVFAESGLFFGFFLPGDSLLLTAGLFAYEGHLNIWILMPLVFVAALLGDNVGYWFGRKAGPPLFTREASLLFKPKNLLAARNFYEKHGGKTIILAQFIPILRTFAPVVAGVAEMGYTRFATYNVVGAILWVAGMTLAGYALGNMVPNIEQRIHYVVAVVIAISLLPPGIAWLRRRRT